MNRLRFLTHYLLCLFFLPALFIIGPNISSALLLALLLLPSLIYLDAFVFRPLGRMEQKAKYLLSTYQEDQAPPKKLRGVNLLEYQFDLAMVGALDQVNRLKEVDRAKSEFLSIVSHELRTPLTSIKGSLGILRSGALGPMPANSARMLEIADIETERLIYLISELLDLAKIEARQLTLQPDWFCLENQLQEIKDSLIGLTHPRGIEIQIEMHEPVEIYADKLRLKQIAQNLLSNAIKHSPKEAVVQLSVSNTDGALCIAVRDQGPGIAPKDLHRIFEKFTQASHPSISTQGTGLGLTIARELVHLHGGSIHVESEPGAGAKFFFIMPDWRPLSRSQDEAA